MRVFLMTLGALVLTLGPSSAALAGDDEAAIRELYKKYAAAWNKGEAKEAAALYDAEASYTNASGVTSRGREAIEKESVDWFAGRYKGTNLGFTVGAIKLLKPDVAVGDGTWKITGMKGPDGAELPPVKGCYTNTLVKKDGKWLVVAEQIMIPPPPPPEEK
jgi:uncharacterized protein (TIGR02246 family)